MQGRQLSSVCALSGGPDSVPAGLILTSADIDRSAVCPLGLPAVSGGCRFCFGFVADGESLVDLD